MGEGRAMSDAQAGQDAQAGHGVQPGRNEGFVHLRARSAYSLLEGAIKAEALGPLARADGMPALALTDRANLFGALEFSTATQGAGVQPIVGCALPVSGLGEGPVDPLFVQGRTREAGEALAEM